MSDQQPSAYATAARELLALGYHPLPIIAPGSSKQGAGKAPGDFRAGAWAGMGRWQEFRDKPPSEFQLQVWTRNYTAANVGLVLGTSAGPGHHVIAVDVDTDDAKAFQAILQALPASPMVKRGRKGETRFYRSPKTIKSRPYDDERQRAADKAAGVTGAKYRLVDLLTGFDTRQTVCPPSVHPEGPTYTWLAGPVAATDLPIFGDDELQRLEAALAELGWEASPPRPDRPHTHQAPTQRNYAQSHDTDDIWSEVKAAALDDLDRWVPYLGLYGLERARGGYEAVATWRASASGRPLEQRKRNLSIQPSGIKDWGDNRGYSAIDLVMAVQSIEQDAATQWLRERMGLVSADVIVLTPKPAAIVTQLRTTDTVEPTPAMAAVADIGELPVELTRIPGLLGELVDWIADSARRPQRGLALGAALTILGTAAGRKYAGPTRTGTQLYVLGLARTSAGKDHALSAIDRLMTSANMGRHLCGAFISMTAVINRLAKEPLTLAPIDEFGSFLKRVNSKGGSAHERAVTGILRTTWGSSFNTVRTPEWAGRGSEPIHSPALSIYGVSTFEDFYEGLSGGDVNNGFLNRFLLLSTRQRPAERDPKADPFVVPESIRVGLHRIYGSGSALVQATTNNGQADGPAITATWADSAARAVYTEFGRAVEDREADMAFLARTVEMAQRLATIRAIGIRHDAPRITVADMEWGRDVALWSAERMMAETADYMAETETHAHSQRIVRIVREAKVIRHSDLVRKMQQVRARELKEMLGSLVEAGLIVCEAHPSQSGPPAKAYRVPV